MKQSSSISLTYFVLVLLAVVALFSAGFVANPPAAEALTVSQCNGTDNQGDRALECHYLVTNNLNGAVTSSTIELTACSGFRADPATMVCSTPPPISSPDLVTSVEQCNGSGNLRATVTCSVEIVNNITATVTATRATVNQCDGSGAGGGALPLNCDPYETTTSATVTQCNDSGNGGGDTQRVNCSVHASSTTTSLLPVTVNQCNNSGNGGYGYLYCSARLTDVITAPAASPSPSPSVNPSPSTTPSPTASPVAPPPPNPPNPNPPPPNPPPPNPPPSPSPSATPTPTASPTAGPNPDVTPTPSITPSPDTTLEPDETIGGDAGDAGAGGDAGGGDQATGGGGRAGGGEGTAGLRGGRLREEAVQGTGTRRTGVTTTGQVTRVPTGGANTGGGSTSGIENPRLLLLGFALLAAAWPAFAVRRRGLAPR